MKENESFILSGNELKPVTKAQKIEQWFYGVSEPYILKFADFMLADMMTTMKHTGIKEKFIPIETAEEAKEKLRYHTMALAL